MCVCVRDITNKYVNVSLGKRVGTAVTDPRLLLPVWTRDDRPGMSDCVSTKHLSNIHTDVYMHTQTQQQPPEGTCLYVRAVRRWHGPVRGVTWGVVTGRHAWCVCPSLVFDMLLCQHQGSMNTGVGLWRKMFILSSRQWDCFILKPLCLSPPLVLSPFLFSPPPRLCLAFISSFCPHPSLF